MATIIKRGDKYRAVIRRKGHKAVTKTFDKLTAAKQWAFNAERDLMGVIAAGKHARVGELMRKYITEVEATKTWERTHKSNMLRFARDMDGLTLNDLTATKLVPWAKGRKVSPSTIAQDFTYLTSMLGVAEALWDTPVPWVEIRRARLLLRRLDLLGKTKQRDRRVLPGELEAIVAKARTVLPLRDLIDFAITTTMRISEITRLQRADLDRADKTILIRDRKHPSEKRGNDQRVPLLNGAFEIIERQPELKDEPRIFPFDPNSITTAYQRARARTNFEGLRWHDLRHEGISRLFEQGYQIQEVALVSGHRSWDMLRRYTHLAPASLHNGPRLKVA